MHKTAKSPLTDRAMPPHERPPHALPFTSTHDLGASTSAPPAWEACIGTCVGLLGSGSTGSALAAPPPSSEPDGEELAELREIDTIKKNPSPVGVQPSRQSPNQNPGGAGSAL